MSEDWWEKTIEYAFVIEAFKVGMCDFASPLAGKHERLAADAVFSKASTFVLIEFKKSKAEIPSEKSLFHDYDDAKLKLQSYQHHHFVFGGISENDESRLDLFSEPYFCREASHRPALDCLNSGATAEVFLAYLTLLSELKKIDGRSSSGHVSPEALSTVLGVSNEGKIVSAQPLYEHSPELFPVEIDRPNHAPKSSFGLGMG